MVASPRRFSAVHLWLRPDLVYSPGELLVSASGRVLAAGPLRSSSRPEDFAIFPGLVNAHVHLQIPALSRNRRSFLPWLRAVMAGMGTSSEQEKLGNCQAAITELIASGCTAVGEIDSSGLSARVLREQSISGRCYQEVTGFHLSAAEASKLLQRRDLPATRRCLRGFSPHAPYSVSPALFRACVASHRKASVHVAECAEEVEFLQSGSGPFRDLLEELGRLPAGFKAAACSPVQFLDRVGFLGPDCALVHCQELGLGDAELIAARGAGIVICPGSIEYFRRDPVPLSRWLELGIQVGLGTDSRASNSGLSMLAEMAAAHRLWPEISPEQVLRMATNAAAVAISRRTLGQLAVGEMADFLRVRVGEGRAQRACLEDFTHGRLHILDTFCAGQPLTGKSGYQTSSTIGSES